MRRYNLQLAGVVGVTGERLLLDTGIESSSIKHFKQNRANTPDVQVGKIDLTHVTGEADTIPINIFLSRFLSYVETKVRIVCLLTTTLYPSQPS